MGYRVYVHETYTTMFAGRFLGVRCWVGGAGVPFTHGRHPIVNYTDHHPTLHIQHPIRPDT